MEVSGQLHASAALPPGKESLVPIGWEAGRAPGRGGEINQYYRREAAPCDLLLILILILPSKPEFTSLLLLQYNVSVVYQRTATVFCYFLVLHREKRLEFCDAKQL
jgi:hypothetical protein